ncbi:DMT family transporter [Rhizobium terrae]|uniref:DMT family transporter n=1 Tax=Rhizobium terrae TaxID=2171756 RepID=UPI000E3D3809|nr:DMT family transporter [Rhizobium terrae]
MTRKHSLDSFAILAMVVLCSLWALQQIAIKAAIPEVPPFWQSAIRSIGATILLAGWFRCSGLAWTRGLFWPGLLVGALFSVEFGMLYVSLGLTDAARAALLLYTAPFVVAIGSHFLIPGERLSAAGWIGIVIAFVGTGLVLQASVAIDRTKFLGDALALGAGILWGLTTIAIRLTRLARAPASQTLLYQLGVSSVLLTITALLVEGQTSLPQSLVGWSSLAYQTVIVAAFSFLAWFALIGRYSATKLSVFTFLTPLLAVLAGILLLGERIGIHHGVALAAIIAGIVIVNLYGHANLLPKAAGKQD